MRRIKCESLDCEPTWLSLVPVMLDMTRDEAKIHLTQMAKTCDVIRQAQKNRETLVFHPNGEVEVSK